MNSNQFATTNQNAKLALVKAKDLLDITSKLLHKKKEKNIIQQTQEIVSNPKVWVDPDTSLVWQVDVNGEEYTWDEAFEYAKSLNKEKYGGYDDWRVPNIDKLKSILTSRSNKCSNGRAYFIKKTLLESLNNSVSSDYWSSTDYEGLEGAWYVEFDRGSSSAGFKTNGCCVRCVRAGQ